jgi:hypothetical protein
MYLSLGKESFREMERALQKLSLVEKAVVDFKEG